MPVHTFLNSDLLAVQTDGVLRYITLQGELDMASRVKLQPQDYLPRIIWHHFYRTYYI